ncbi:MAG TPA: sigma-70 family RNA polymerase sigma factor, partial [Kofleriaceae bacterium]|nr:sigma-70 family RNA polymerase sigma factor [Kofleriaceae bacterium]
THTARRRQRPSRRTTTGTAHARPHSAVGTRQNRASATGAVSPSPAPEIEAEVVETTAPTKAVRPVRAPDSDDHLAAYFRQLAEHDLLSPEDERELSQGIEDTEILTWERCLARADVVAPLLALVEPNLEQPVKFPKLQKAIEDLAKAKRKDLKLQKKLVAAANEAAVQLRALDLDRVHIDAVLRELERAREAALAGTETWWTDGATREAGQYLDEVRQAYRDAANLRDEFVRANLRLVVTMARRYDRGGMPLADLIQEGNLGLMHAVSRFDYRRGLRFSTYACWWIRHAIGRALADKARAVRIPVHMLEAQQQLEKVRQQLIRELGRQPTPQEVAKAARVPLAKLNQMHRYLMGQPLSLDRPVHEDDDRQLGEMLADPDSEDQNPAEDLTNEALTKQVRTLMRGLSPIEADVLRQRFGLGDDEERTFREIGDQYRLSRERIRQIQNSALDKLKKALERQHTGLFDN